MEPDSCSVEAAQRMSQYFSNYIRSSQRPIRYLQRIDQWRRIRQGRVHYDWDHVRPVNKSTHLVNKIGYVHSLFPNAKFVFIVRSIEGR